MKEGGEVEWRREGKWSEGGRGGGVEEGGEVE